MSVQLVSAGRLYTRWGDHEAPCPGQGECEPPEGRGHGCWRRAHRCNHGLWRAVDLGREWSWPAWRWGHHESPWPGQGECEPPEGRSRGCWILALRCNHGIWRAVDLGLQRSWPAWRWGHQETPCPDQGERERPEDRGRGCSKIPHCCDHGLWRAVDLGATMVMASLALGTPRIAMPRSR